MMPKGRAQQGLELLKQAIIEYLEPYSDVGVKSSQIARELGLESDFEGQQKNYLSWSIVGLLVNEGKVRYEKRGHSRFYSVNQKPDKAD